MDQPPPGDGLPEGGATKHSNSFLVAMGVIGALMLVLVGFMLTRRPDPGRVEIRFTRIPEFDDALVLLTTWSELGGEEGLRHYFLRLKLADETVPSGAAYGMRTFKQEIRFFVPSRFETNQYTLDLPANLRTWKFFCGKLPIRVDSSTSLYNVVLPDGSVAPISDSLRDLAKKVVTANSREFTLDGVHPLDPDAKKTAEELAVDSKRELELVRQLIAIDPTANGKDK